jgi:hypothetical protein
VVAGALPGGGVAPVLAGGVDGGFEDVALRFIGLHCRLVAGYDAAVVPAVPA